MKTIALILIGVIIGEGALANSPLAISFRVEKQAMSTPHTPLEDIYFNYRYYERPVTVKIENERLHMTYDNNETKLSEEIEMVECNVDFGDEETVKRYFFTMKEDVTDTLMFIIDYDVPYVHLVVPAKNSKGERIGYTSFQHFIDAKELATY